MTFSTKRLSPTFAVLALAPVSAFACACGCGLTAPGTESMFPEGVGGLAYVRYEYQDQNRNWHGAAASAADNNEDKSVRTSTVVFGVRHMATASWGAQLEVPYVRRAFTVDDGAGATATANYDAPGDIRINALYTGLADDMSTGLTFGVKLPTGDFKATDAVVDIDRDTQIGTGSTDALLGAFHYGDIGRADGDLKWFAQAQADLPVLSQRGYVPGAQLDVAAGLSYHGIKWGRFTVAPVAQLIATVKDRDHGDHAMSPAATGYERLLVASGLELKAGAWVVFADVGLPVYQRVTGEQLVPESVVRLMVGCKF